MSTSPVIVWFRNDLRLADNPALSHGVAGGGPVVPVFIWSPDEEGEWSPGAASRWWLHQSLTALSDELKRKGSRLILWCGSAVAALHDLAAETGARSIVWNRRYEPAAIQRDKEARASLLEAGFEAQSFNASLLLEPWDVKTRTGQPYKVFTPYWRACTQMMAYADLYSAPQRLRAPSKWPASIALQDLELEQAIDRAKGLRESWVPGELGAARRLDQFLKVIDDYDRQRDTPGVEGTSMLSPHLHFGEISPRQITSAVKRTLRDLALGSAMRRGPESLLRELGWREFAYQLLNHFPHTTDHPLREVFASFRWRQDSDALRCWQRGMATMNASVANKTRRPF